MALGIVKFLIFLDFSRKLTSQIGYCGFNEDMGSWKLYISGHQQKVLRKKLLPSEKSNFIYILENYLGIPEILVEKFLTFLENYHHKS